MRFLVLGMLLFNSIGCGPSKDGSPLAPVAFVSVTLNNLTPSVGQTVECIAVTNRPAALNYQWQTSGNGTLWSLPVQGANPRTITAFDVGLYLRCRAVMQASPYTAAISNATTSPVAP